MHTSVYLLLLCPVLAAAVAPWLAPRLAPAALTRALAALAAAGAVATAAALVVLAAGGLGRTDEVLSLLHPGRQALADDDSIPRALGALAAVAVVAAAARVLRVLAGRARLIRALAPVRAIPAAGDLVVVEDADPDAYALPGRPRRIVVSTGMLRALSTEERAVLLAHERAHLVHRHDRYRTAADLAVAVNPLLRPLSGRLAFALERWADEEAAAAVASRSLTARALARAALAGADRKPGGIPVLAFVRHRLAARIAALQAGRPVNRAGALWSAAAVPVLTAATLGDVTASLLNWLEALHP